LLLLWAGLLVSGPALAHPGSGIVADRHGNIYFLDTGSGIWKISPDGKLTKISGPAYHWMAIDHAGALSKTDLPNFSRGGAVVEHSGEDPRIIVSSDFPVAVGPDGGLYYGWTGGADAVTISRLTPAGKTEVVKTLPASRDGVRLGWLNGILVAQDGGVYYSEADAIRRVGPDGAITTIADKIVLGSCDTLRVESGPGPYLRGFDVDSAGTVYAAATGCRSVVKIVAGKAPEVLLRAESPWSPTAVARSGKDLYVLEYLHIPAEDRRAWIPRVRKLDAAGAVTTVATIER
jgi:hypothetical protein